MQISAAKKSENIAEYILYMYYVEDTIRKFKFNIPVLMDQYVNPIYFPPILLDLCNSSTETGVLSYGNFLIEVNNRYLSDFKSYLASIIGLYEDAGKGPT